MSKILSRQSLALRLILGLLVFVASYGLAAAQEKNSVKLPFAHGEQLLYQAELNRASTPNLSRCCKQKAYTKINARRLTAKRSLIMSPKKFSGRKPRETRSQTLKLSHSAIPCMMSLR